MIGVILAAGRGERLRPVTDNLPKGLITLNSRTLLEYSLSALAACGIRKVIIVVGYLAGEVKSRLGASYAGVELVYVESREYATCGSMLSLYLARDLITEDIVLLESDLIFDPSAIDTLIQSGKRNVILVAPCRGNGDEVFIHTDPAGHLTGLGKQTVNEGSALGELVGISKLSLPFLHNLCTQAETQFKQNNKSISYEDAIILTVKNSSDPVDCILLNNLLWTDIDTTDDFERAKEILPKIIELNTHTTNSPGT